jgi:hypothetical protein
MPGVSWKNEPDDHDYPAARAYLSLIAPDDVVERVVDDLRSATIAHQKARDILRASALALLGVDNAHVASDLQKIRKGHDLSPVCPYAAISRPTARCR